MSKPDLPLDSIAARAVAEYASSLRGPSEERVFIVSSRTDKRWKMRVKRGLAATGPDQVATPVATPFVQPNRPPVEQVSILAKGMDQPKSLDEYDAVFWSESSVEKFVFPYYASKCQWEAAHVLSALSKAFYGYVPGGPDGAPQEIDEETIPFAVGHLPRSDYATIDEEPTSMGHDLHLLFRKGDGTVHARPLAEFL